MKRRQFAVQGGGATTRPLGTPLSRGVQRPERGREEVYRDLKLTNCIGHIPSGNCLGNPLWHAPNADWWTWGLGFSHRNPGYDGGGGWSTGNYPVDPFNAEDVSGYTFHKNGVVFNVYQRTRQNCNCGNFNCYTNCNCNCACACNCACDCLCFLPTALARMATGDERPLVDVKIGDELADGFGGKNVVLGIHRVKLGDRRLVRINGRIDTTGDHLFLTKRGWAAAEPALYAGRRFNRALDVDGITADAGRLSPEVVHKMAVGDVLVTPDGEEPIHSLEVVSTDPSLDLLCPLTDGTGTFVVEGVIADAIELRKE